MATQVEPPPDMEQGSAWPELPEGFSLLMPGLPLQQGDIGCAWQGAGFTPWKRITREQEGQPKGPHEELYARIWPPEGYTLVPGFECSVTAREHLRDEWFILRIDKSGTSLFQPTALERSLLPSQVAPTLAQGSWYYTVQAIPVTQETTPGEWRTLGEHESIRASDRLPREGRGTPLAAREFIGAIIGLTVEHARHRYPTIVTVERAIGSGWQQWYVHELPGTAGRKAKAVGSKVDPFLSLQSAVQTIAKTFRRADKSIHGVIVDHVGRVLKAYDLPEEAEPEAAPAFTHISEPLPDPIPSDGPSEGPRRVNATALLDELAQAAAHLSAGLKLVAHVALQLRNPDA